MPRALLVLLTVIVLAVTLVGCGGGSSPLAPPPDGGGAPTEVGPMQVRTASAAGFVVEEIPANYSPMSFAALYGSEITWLASQAMLDRIVYVNGTETDADIFVCNLDGSGRVRLTNNSAGQYFPCWSPDGTQIAFTRVWPGQDSEVMMMNADGTGVVALTANTFSDGHPSFSPEGRRLAFATDRVGNYEVFVMYTDGSGAANLTNHPAKDVEPDWSSELASSRIAFTSGRDGADEIYVMASDGTVQTRLTTNTHDDNVPAWHPDAYTIAYEGRDLGTRDILSMTSSGYDVRNLSASAADQIAPAWSSDGRFICYSSEASGNHNLVLQEAEEPWGKFGLTTSPAHDAFADLGSPTLQTDRVLIGPAGSDWGGTDPVFTSAYAGIAVWDSDGYHNFVRIGVASTDLGSLRISPLMSAAQPPPTPVGVVVAANRIPNLRADGGRGRPAIVWDFTALNPTAVLIYFHAWTGKVLSAAVLRDSVLPTAAGAGDGAVRQSVQGGDLIAQGEFAAVFDAQGRRVAGEATSLTITAQGEVIVR